MKKITKIFAAFAALTLVAGAFASCSSEDEWVQTKAPTPPATKYKCAVCQHEYDTQAEASACDSTSACPGYVAPEPSLTETEVWKWDTWMANSVVTAEIDASNSNKLKKSDTPIEMGKVKLVRKAGAVSNNVDSNSKATFAAPIGELAGYVQIAKGKSTDLGLQVAAPKGTAKIGVITKSVATNTLLCYKDSTKTDLTPSVGEAATDTSGYSVLLFTLPATLETETTYMFCEDAGSTNYNVKGIVLYPAN